MGLLRRYHYFAFVKKALTVCLIEYGEEECVAEIYDGGHLVCKIEITGENLTRLARDEVHEAAFKWIDENYEVYEPH